MTSLFRVVLAVALLLTASVVMAAPLCVNGTVSSYVALGTGGCTIGDKLFSSFEVTNAGAWVNVTVLNPDPYHMGFQFGGVFLANAGAPFVASMSYNVEVIGGDDLIHDMELHVGGVGVIPPGVLFTVGEDILDFNGNVLALLEVGNSTNVLVLTDLATFGPVDFITVNKDITIVNNSNQAFNFSEMTQIVSQVPEPTTSMIVGVGLLAAGMLRRRR